MADGTNTLLRVKIGTMASLAGILVGATFSYAYAMTAMGKDIEAAMVLAESANAHATAGDVKLEKVNDKLTDIDKLIDRRLDAMERTMTLNSSNINWLVRKLGGDPTNTEAETR